MIDQEKIVDDIMLDELELKVPGCKEHINNTDSKKKRLGMLSVLGSNYNRDYFEGYRSLIVKEKVCAEYITDIVYTLRNYIETADTEIKTYGEVMTPLRLVDEMLDTLPKHVWKNPKLKWLDPANGVGTFPSVIVKRLMVGLKDIIPDSCERYRHIVENMIYVVEIQPKNMFLYHCAFDINNTHELKTYYGSFLSKGFDEHMKNVWGVEKFDIVIGNPPYQEQVGPKKTKSIWNLFVKKSISLLSTDGFMVTVHPSGWRSLDGDFKDVQIMIKRNLLHLEMHDDKDGLEMFGATTSYDFYCYSNKFVKETKVKDQKSKFFNIDLSSWEFIPAGGFDIFSNLVAKNNEDKVNVIYSRSAYGTDKSHMSKEQIGDFTYPCVYTIIKNNTINLFWSKTNKNGHFNVPKVIWSNGMASPPTVDPTGQYGLTQFAYAIVDDITNLYNIKKSMGSEKFIETMKLCYMSSGNRFDRKVLSTFKKDFWKEFINEE
jgi:hypothetical protein